MGQPWEAYQSEPTASGPWNEFRTEKKKPRISEADQKMLDEFVAGESFGDRFNAGAGKAMTDTYRGIKQLLGVGDQEALQREIDERKKGDAPLMDTGGGIAGNIAGHVASLAIPGTAAAKGAMAVPRVASAVEALLAARPIASAVGLGATTGAAEGLIEPVATGESRGRNVMTNAAFGAAGGALPGVASKVMSGAKLAPGTQLLKDEGVRMTPGQLLGGMAKTIEDKATSIPGLGYFIKGAQTRSIEDFNVAAINRALAPIGEKVDRAKFAVGREGVGDVEKRIGTAYDNVLNKIGRVDLDATFDNEIARIGAMAQALGRQNADQFDAILQTRLLDKLTPARSMSADTMKEVESDLGRFAANLRSSPDPMQRDLSDALREVQASLRRNVERGAGPAVAGELRGANEAWANFVRIQDAAARAGSLNGIATPAQLTAATRKQDKSVRKGAFARGDALMQDLAEAGKDVLPNKVPNSGTVDRLLNAGVPGALPFLSPEALAGGAVASLPYTAMGGRAMQALLTERPELARYLAEILAAGAPAGGIAAGMAAPSLTGP